MAARKAARHDLNPVSMLELLLPCADWTGLRGRLLGREAFGVPPRDGVCLR